MAISLNNHEERIKKLEESGSSGKTWYKTGSWTNQNVAVDSMSKYTAIGVSLRLSGQIAVVPISLFKTGMWFDNKDYSSGPIYGYSFKYINDTTINIGSGNGNSCDCTFIFLM